MAFSISPLLPPPASLLTPFSSRCVRTHSSSRFVVRCSNAAPARLVTFVGKGGVGKTTCAVLAAQYYASLGLRTCLAVQSQDTTADFLLGDKLGTFSSPFRDGPLSAFRLESTKLLLEPWSELKKADAELNFTQGVLDEVASEEFSILPGMDSFLAIGLLDRLLNFSGDSLKIRPKLAERYDIVVYDGANSEETLRILGAAERILWYLRRLRALADKTDTGRVTLPSILKVIESTLLDGAGERSTAEIWAAFDSIFSRIATSFGDPRKFGCYVVTDLHNKLASGSALRYWGCAVQAGVHVSGALHVASPEKADLLLQSVREKYQPLILGEVPRLTFEASPNWKEALSGLQQETREMLENKHRNATPPSVVFDKSARTTTLFLPGFEKTEIKLSQWRGGSELLVEAGDQRRSISLPSEMRGKVVGAKFQNKSLIVSIGSS